MGDVPPFTLKSSFLTGSGANVVLNTPVNGNVIAPGSTFTLGFRGAQTAEIAYDASDVAMQQALEALSIIESVNVVRNGPDYQHGYKWKTTFTSSSALNAGAMPMLAVGADSKLTGVDAAAAVQQLAGSFQLKFTNGAGTTATTSDLAWNCDAATMKAGLEKLNTGTLDVSRTQLPDPQDGFTWTISFLTLKGSVAALTSDLTRLTETRMDTVVSKGLAVTRTRPGTVQEIQNVKVTTTAVTVSTATFFSLKVSFASQTTTTGLIPANAMADGTCVSTMPEIQQIKVTTVDTTAAGGDNLVSSKTAFQLIYTSNTRAGSIERTNTIVANPVLGDCSIAAAAIRKELEALDGTVGTIAVSSSATVATQACTWAVTFSNQPRNLVQLQVVTSSSGDPVNAQHVDENVPFYFRVTAINPAGLGTPALSTPQFAIPTAQIPSVPTNVSLASVDGTSIAVRLNASMSDGGSPLDAYRVEYGLNPIRDEVQEVQLRVPVVNEIQTIITSTNTVGEVQLVHLMSTYLGPAANEVQRVSCDALSTGTGSFTLSFLGETTAPISVTETSTTAIQATLQELASITSVSVSFYGSRTAACAPCSSVTATGCTSGLEITFVSVVGRQGDMPLLTANTYNLEGNRRVDIVEKTTGQAPVSGTFRLTYLRGRDTDTVPLLFSASATTVQAAIATLDASVTVVVTDGTSALPPADVTAGARLWRVTFQNSGYIPDMLVRPANNLLMGDGADIKIYTKGATYGAVPVSVAGNRVTGKFRLALGSHVTDLIDYDASDTTMKRKLEALPNIGTVTVTRTGPSLKNEYVWTVTFIANSGSFPVGAGNIDPLTADSTALLGTNSQITIATLQQGSLSVDGTFQLKFTDGVAPVQSTIDLSPHETADGIQRALRGISSIGDVSVSRSTATNGYTWQVTFNNCRASVCNIGDANMMTSDTTKLTGGAGTSVPTVTIVEVVKGVGPLQTLLITDLSGGEPYETLISSLLYGTKYYARVSFHNAISFGHRTLSVPEFVTTKNLPPGAPRPVLLVSSSATTITLAWTPPTINGGETVSGYELWLSEWGDVYCKVYDRPNDATTLTATLTTTADDHRGQCVTSGYTASGLPVNNEIQRIQTMVATPVPEIQSITVIDASGQFTLYINRKTTALLTAGMSATGAATNAQVKAAIETCGIGTVAVTSTALSTGMTWTVTFSTWQGPLATMVIVPDKLTNTVLATAYSTQVTRVQAGTSALGGDFTVSFRGFETTNLAVSTTAAEMKRQLENLPSLGVVAVSATAGINNAMTWDTTFLTELGDVPLVKVTSGRLTGGTPKVLVSTMQEGTPGRIVYDGTMAPDVLAFTSMNLVPDTLYAYAVVAINAAGDGIGGVSTPAIAASSGASSFQTVAYGPALVQGMAGIVYEVQSVATSSLAAGTFKLRWSAAGPWIGPISTATTAAQLETLLPSTDSSLGEVHVSRQDLNGADCVWYITFVDQVGDLPLLVSDDVVHVLIQEFVKGEANQFAIAPRMASGDVVTYATMPPGFQGQDLFWTELWSSPPSIVDGTHSFVSDGGLAVYNPVVYEIQTITFNGVTGTFNFKLDTSTSRLGGVVATSAIAVNAATLAASTTSDATASQLIKTSLETLSNLETVSVSRVKNTGGGATSWTYAVTFISNLCDLPLLQLVGDTAFMTSSTLLTTTPVIFTEIQKGVCDVQTVTTSASVESSAEIQSIHTWLDDSGTPTTIGGAFALAFDGAETITVLVTADAATMKALSRSLQRVSKALVVLSSDFTKLPSHAPLKRGDLIVVGSESHRVLTTDGVVGTATLSLTRAYLGEFNAFVSVYKAGDATGRHVVSFVPYVKGRYQLSVKVPRVDAVYAVIATAVSSLGGTFQLSFGKTARTSQIAFNADTTTMKTALENVSGIPGGVITASFCVNNDATQGCRWLITFAFDTVGKVELTPVYDGVLTGNNAKVTTQVLTESRNAQMVRGFPKIIDVRPGPTNPSVSTAYGRGLYTSVAGENATFYIQMKDTHGNNKDDRDTLDALHVRVFPNAASFTDSQVATIGPIRYVSEGLYNVTYSPIKSGVHTVTVTTQTKPEIQQVSTVFAQITDRGGSFALRFKGNTTGPLAFNANASDVQTALLNLLIFSAEGSRSSNGNATATQIKVTRSINAVNFGFDYQITFTSVPWYIDMEPLDFVNNLYGANGNPSIVVQVLQRQGNEHIKTTTTLGTPIVNEIQVVRVETTGTALTGGYFQVAFNGHVTDLLRYDITAIAFQAALETLPSIGIGGVIVTKSGVDPLGSCRVLVVDEVHARPTGPKQLLGDTRRTQKLQTTASTQLSGTFYVSYHSETNRTPMLPWNVDAVTLGQALEALDGLHTVSVSAPMPGLNGGFTWMITLVSTEVDDLDLELLYAEGYMLLGDQARVSVDAVCPSTVTSVGEVLSSQSGRLGHSFVATLTGADTVSADVTYLSAGKYVATYDTPRADSYTLEVQYTKSQGLRGTYFNNRWLYGDPEVVRIDRQIDFMWRDWITPTAKDYVSVRWDGYIKPAFTEDYVVSVVANDGARLWIQNQLVFDYFDNEIDESNFPKVVEFRGNTTIRLVKDRLAEILIEYKENAGFASIQLLWESRSQEKAVIPPERLFHRSVPIASSPFAIATYGVKSTAPVNVSLAIAAFDALTVSFYALLDDGGSNVNGYLVEWWTSGAYGTPEVQLIKLDKANTGGTFTIELDTGFITGPLAVATVLYLDMEAAIEALDGAGDVTVVLTSAPASTTMDFQVTFNTRTQTVPTMKVNGNTLIGSGLFGVCSKGSTTPTGNPGAVVTCLAGASTTSTVSILDSSMQVSLDVRKYAPYKYTIKGLSQAASTVTPSAPGVGGTDGPGFDVRVTALTSAGYGIPSAPVTMKPMAVPAVPENIGLHLVAMDPASLRVVWDAPLTDNAAKVTYYTVEWRLMDLNATFNSGSGGMASSLLDSDNLSASAFSFREVPGYFLTQHPSSTRYKFTISSLKPGFAYYVNVRAENIMGVGLPGIPVPSFEMPRAKADQLFEGVRGVSLSVIPAGTSKPTSGESYSVTESCSSLRLAWLPSPNVNGAKVTKYLLEWFELPATQLEVQLVKIAGQSASDPVSGTFQISYSGATTDDLPIDVDETEVQQNLEALATLRSVHVERSPASIKGGYEWTITFLTEAPAVLGKTLQVVSDKLVATAVSVDVGANLDAAHVGAVMKTVVAVQGTVIVTNTGIESYAVIGMYMQVTGNGAEAGIWRVMAVATDTITLDQAFRGATGSYTAQIGWTVPGTFPLNYHTLEVMNTTAPLSYTISNLPPGVKYYARVSACNSLGCSTPRRSTPLALAPPKQRPAMPRKVQIFTETATTLRVLWTQPLSDGGDVITQYRLEWDLSPSFNSGPNGSSLGYDVKALANPGIDCLFTPCEAIVGALTTGKPYYVRVYAYNSFGYSLLPGVGLPAFAVPQTQASPPDVVVLEPIHITGSDSSSGLQVRFNTTHNNGGADVTQYKIEWDAMDLDAIEDRAVASAAAATALKDEVLFSPIYNTDAAALSRRVRCAWFVPSLLYGRRDDFCVSVGYRRRRTRHSARAVGSANTNGVVGQLPLLRVSIDSTELYNAFSTSKSATATTSLLGTNAKLDVVTVIQGMNGFEQQVVTVATDLGNLGGNFQLIYNQKKSELIPFDVSATALKHTLYKLAGGSQDVTTNVGRIDVFKKAAQAFTGLEYTIVFRTRLGPHQPLLGCDGSGLKSTSAQAALRCDTKADIVDANGLATYAIQELRPGVQYHVRVSAWNGVGNVFGETRYSTPAVVSVQSQPGPPQDLSITASSASSVLAAWSPPMNNGGSRVQQYIVQYDTLRGVSEEQVIRLTSPISNLRGVLFTLHVHGRLETNPVAWDASADDMKRALVAVLSSNGGGITSVTRKPVLYDGYGYEWRVIFSDTMDDVPLLVANVEPSEYSNDATMTVEEWVKGTVSAFSRGPSAVIPTVTVVPRHEVQEIFISSGSRIDLGGFVTLSFCGESTATIAVDASASVVKAALEGLLTVGEVNVTTKRIITRDLLPLQHYGVKWIVTFASTTENVPLILVRTHASKPFTHLVCGGTLTGTTPCAKAKEITPGGLPKQIAIPSLDNNATSFMFRFAASNVRYQSDFAVYATPFQTKNRTPFQVNDVLASPLSMSSIGVRWKAPEYDGGEAIAHYKVQWDSSNQFEMQSIYAGSDTVVAPQSSDSKSDQVLTYAITGLDATMPVFVRVLAYNSLGYGEPALATPVSTNFRIARTVVKSTSLTNAIANAQTFKLKFQNFATLSTVSIPINGDALALENAVAALDIVSTVSVSRNDHSLGEGATLFDESGIDTLFAYRMEWTITFLTPSADAIDPNTLGNLVATLDAAPAGVITQADITVYEVRAATSFVSIQAQAVPSTGPLDVRVSVVDASSLGVSWAAPSSASSPARKYLVEWSDTPDFMQSTPQTGGATYAIAAAHTQMVPSSAKTYTIRDLSAGTAYFVRVSAFNGDLTAYADWDFGYGCPVLASVVDRNGLALIPAPESIIPAAVVPCKPTTVTMRVSTMDIPNYLEVLFTEPTLNALGFLAGNGGTDITSYRVTWDTNPDFKEHAVSYDVRTLTACTVSPCMSPIGAEVQSLSLSPDTSASSFRISMGGAFSVELCASCPIAFDVANKAHIDYTGSPVDLKASLGTNAFFVVDQANKACVFQVAATTTPVANRLPLVPGNAVCALSDGAYSVHMRPTTPCIAQSITDTNLQVALRSLVSDDVQVALDSTPLVAGRKFWITFTGAKMAARGDIEQLMLSATDNTAGCTALVGTAWTNTEIHGGLLQSGTLYYVQVGAINSVGVGEPQPATSVCHDPPCVNPLRLAPAAPPQAPTNVVVANDRHDRTALKVKWQAPLSASGATITNYIIEYSTDAFTPVLLCANCAQSLSQTTLTLGANVVLAANQLLELSSLTPKCLVVAQGVAAAWNAAKIVYTVAGNHGCDDFSAGSVTINALHGTGSGYITVVPSDVQFSTDDSPPQVWFRAVLTGLTSNTVYTVHGIEACTAASAMGASTLVMRQLPSAPVLELPTQLLSQGTNTVNANGFTENTLSVSFRDPSAWTGLEGVDWYRLEWDLQPDFKPTSKQSVIVQVATTAPSLWPTLQVCASCATTLSGTNAETLTATNPNQDLDIRVSDYLTLNAGLTSGMIDQLTCQFQPMILLPTDLNGNGGSTITKYLVEWSDKDFSAMQSHVQVISTTSSSSLKVSGAFRLALDTTGCANCQVKSLHLTSAIPFDTTALSMTNILQNLPNVGQVSVSRAPCSANSECTWKVTFVSEVGAVPDFTVAQNLLSTENGVVRIQISSLVVNGGQVGNLVGATYCPSTTTVGGVVTLNSGPSACGFVVPTVESPLPYKYLIQGLTPGTTYLVRVSALNALGYGIRRLSASTSMAVPFEPPSVPRLLFNTLASPVLTLAGPTALVVAYGPPVFSGGPPVTGYTIEWDPKPSFDSGTNGDALGQVIRTGGSGGKYRIDKLTTAQWWYVRVYAMNAEIGAGLPELTSPEREMPRQKPLPPRDVMISNGKTLPLGYSFNRTKSNVQTTGAIASGSFTLAYGDGSERFPYRVLPGTLDVVHGQNYVTTSTDLTGLLARGDVIVIDDVTYLAATTGTFSSTQLPLADATNFATKTGSTLATTRIAYSGTTKSSIPAKTLWKTIDMSYDITPSAMKEALEMLPTVGIVHVERFQVGAVGNNNFEWDITFSTQVPSPSALPTFTVNERNLVATINNADVSASVTQLSQVPLAFGFATVLATADASGAGSVPFSYNITQLTNGVP
ncbi:Projectin/twitchin, partial [Globisporangium splendens]